MYITISRFRIIERIIVEIENGELSNLCVYFQIEDDRDIRGYK